MAAPKLGDSRRFHRVNLSLPIRIKVSPSNDSDKELWTAEGILKNISFGGIFLICKPTILLGKDHSRKFTLFLDAKSESQNLLEFTARVTRIELTPGGKDLNHMGVALEYIVPPLMEGSLDGYSAALHNRR